MDDGQTLSRIAYIVSAESKQGIDSGIVQRERERAKGKLPYLLGADNYCCFSMHGHLSLHTHNMTNMPHTTLNHSHMV